MPVNDFPHSKQNGLARGVISPQKGHILCDPKPSVFFANSFRRDSTINASKARVWKRKGCISDTRCFQERAPLRRIFDRLTITHRRRRFCARLLNLPKERSVTAF